MKKLLTLTAVGAILSTPASAVQKCVALDKNDTQCTSSYSSYRGKANWEATCTTNGVSVPIKGIAACSQEAGPVPGAVNFDDSQVAIELLPTVASNGMYNNNNCWCRIISPAISRWVYTGETYADVADCTYNCAKECAYMIADKRSENSYGVRYSLFRIMSY